MVMSFLKLHAQALVAALQFLTRLPIPLQVPFERPVLARSVIYYPIAGLLIGLVVSGGAWLLPMLLPPWPAAVLLLVLWTALSGGLHMDGWMDTADAVLSYRSRERMLEIMKDSRVGAMGVLAAVLLLLFKASLIAELLAATGNSALGLNGWFAVWVFAAVWSRTWMVAAMTIWPPARKDEGLASLFNGIKFANVAAACALATAISLMTLNVNGVMFLNSLAAIAAVIAISAVVGGWMAWSLNRKLGGLTGDTYGAINEAVETAVLAAVVCWMWVG